MRQLLFIPVLLFFITVHGQTEIYDSYTADTIVLQDIHYKKIVAYQLDSVTLLVSYDDYKKALSVFWKRYREGMKGTEKARKEGQYVNSEYEPRWRVIDSVYTSMRQQAKARDTIHISQTVFDRVGLGYLNDFFPNLIDKKQCRILDKNHRAQPIIIRRKGSRIREPLGSYGGRSYYLPGRSRPFVSVRDWST